MEQPAADVFTAPTTCRSLASGITAFLSQRDDTPLGANDDGSLNALDLQKEINIVLGR
jgi:hypothetical protein